jgi:hypothetical protein
MKETNSMLSKLLSTFCCLSLLLTGCAQTGQRFGVVFTANLNGAQDIYSAQSPDFKNIERLTFTPVDEESLLKMDAKGNRLLFYAPAPSPERIMAETITPPANYPHTYIYDLKAKASIDIDFPLDAKTPILPQSWAADGNTALLSDGSTNKIYTMNINTADVQEIGLPISKGAYSVEVSYSPDGKQLAYTENSNFSGEFHLVIYTPFIYDFGTQAASRIGDGSADCYNPQWSPAGRQILLTCNLSTDGVTVIPRTRLFNIDVDEKVVLTKEVVDLPCTHPAWSPDGKQFAMICTQNSHSGIFLANSDGSDYEEIKIGANIPSHVRELVWSPSGQQILFVAGEERESSSIYMIDVDGVNFYTITEQKANYANLSVFTVP